MIAILFVWGWRLDGLVLLLHERCCGLGEGAVFRAHDEIEGACAAGSGSVIGEGIGVDGEDGSGPASSGPVVGIFAVSDAACDRFEGLAPDSVEFLLGPLAGHEVLLQAVWGRGKSARARGCFRFPVSLHPWGAGGGKQFEVSAGLVALCGLDGLSGADEFAQCVSDGLGAHSGCAADLGLGEGLFGLGEDGVDALARVLCVRREGWGLRFGDVQGESLWRGFDLELEIVQVGCDAVVGGEQDAFLASAQDENHVQANSSELPAGPVRGGNRRSCGRDGRAGRRSGSGAAVGAGSRGWGRSRGRRSRRCHASEQGGRGKAGAIVVGIDESNVRAREKDREGRLTNFEVLVGKSMTEDQGNRYFRVVRSLDEKPNRRPHEVLPEPGLQMNQEITFLTDGEDSIRSMAEFMTPCAEHVLDGLHTTLRITVLRQYAKGLLTRHHD